MEHLTHGFSSDIHEVLQNLTTFRDIGTPNVTLQNDADTTKARIVWFLKLARDIHKLEVSTENGMGA